MNIGGGMVLSKQQELGYYYLRLGIGFYTLWLAWDMIVHQIQWRAFYAAFPVIGGMAEFWLITIFFLYLVLGSSLLTGWMHRASSLVLIIMLFFSIVPMGFLTPEINPVLGPFRALTIKNIVWLGACLVLFIHPADSFQPERRQRAGREAWADKSKFVFRLLLGGYFIWNGFLLLTNHAGYLSVMTKAVTQLPLLTVGVASSLLAIGAIIQLAAGLMIMTGIQYKWALLAVMTIVLLQLLGVNWQASKDLLRAGGRFMMRDVVIFSSALYFWLTGPGINILKIKVERNVSSLSSKPADTPALDQQPPENLF